MTVVENLPIGNIQDFKEYSQFSTIEDFNNQIEQWMVEYKHIFTKSELLCLKRLIRFSAKIYGVAIVKINTILQSIAERDFQYGVSRSSFERMLRKAKRIGMIEVINTVRKNNSQSSNLYIFQRFTTLDAPRTKGEQVEALVEQQSSVSENNTLDAPNKTNNHSKTSKHIIKKRMETLDYTFTMEYVPKQFRDLVKCFFNDAKVIEEFWKMVHIIAYKYVEEDDVETMIDTAICAFKQTINKLKKGKVRNMFAYFTGILRQKYERIYFEHLFEMGFVPSSNNNNYIGYNWLDQ